MDRRRRAISLAGLTGLAGGFTQPALGQAIQERTIRFTYDLANSDELARIHKG